jgi:glycosyltransferase involved in cell wall biosynthesis
MPGTDASFWKPSCKKSPIFTFIFDSFANVRSGLDLALQAYEKAFRFRKDVQLIIKNTATSKKLASKILEYSLRENNISFINDRLSFEQMRDLYSASHVMLSVMRHSSWGLGIHQAAACGCLPIVGDFCPSNEMAIDIKLKPSTEVEINSFLSCLTDTWGLHNAYGDFSYNELPRFYDYSIQDYAMLMSDIYKNWKSVYSKIDTRTRIVENWTLKQSAENLVKALQS